MEKSKLIAIANKLSNVFLKKYSGKMKPSDAYQSLRENEMYKPLFSKPNGDILIISFVRINFRFDFSSISILIHINNK